MAVQNLKLGDLRTALLDRQIDLLIASASFEERCLSVPAHLDVGRIGAALIARNRAYRDAVDNNFRALEQRFAAKCNELLLDSDDPVASADEIASVVGAALAKDRPRRILVDITTFTREFLLMLLAYLRGAVSDRDSVDFVYTHAKDYSVDQPMPKKWLSRGIRDVRSVLGFPGRMIPSRRTHLLVMVGFEDERALELIRECEPSFVSLGLADDREEGTKPHQPINVDRFKNVRAILDRVGEFTFSAYDPSATKESLRKQAATLPDCNVVIAPMNTKMSTIGAALFAFENDSVQLCYAPANMYNVAAYSIPDEDVYLFRLAGFGKADETKEARS